MPCLSLQHHYSPANSASHRCLCVCMFVYCTVFGPSFPFQTCVWFSYLVVLHYLLFPHPQFPQSTLQVQTKRRLAVDLSDSFKTSSVVLWVIGSLTVTSLHLSFLTLIYSFFSFSLIISTSLLNDSSFHPLLPLWMLSLSGTSLQPLWKAVFTLKTLSPSEKPS